MLKIMKLPCHARIFAFIPILICFLGYLVVVAYFDILSADTAAPWGTNKASKKGKRLYDPNHGYEPYWPGGHWVLYGDPDAPSTTEPPMVCGEECHYLYMAIGKVCARTTNNRQFDGCRGHLFWWCYGNDPDNYTSSYYTVNTYCEFLDLQCRSKLKQRWVFVHEGECLYQDDYFKPMSTDLQIVSRMESYIGTLEQRFNDLGKEPC